MPLLDLAIEVKVYLPSLLLQQHVIENQFNYTYEGMVVPQERKNPSPQHGGNNMEALDSRSLNVFGLL